VFDFTVQNTAAPASRELDGLPCSHVPPPFPFPFPAVTGIFRFALFLFMKVGYILPGQPYSQAMPTSDFNPLVVQLRTDETTDFEVFHVVGPLSGVDTTRVSGVLFFHVSI